MAEDDIQSLERKLEYMKAKEKLDIELKIIKAKINKLKTDYADVIEKQSTTSDSSSSSTVAVEPETSPEPKAEPEVQTSSTSIPDNQEWEYDRLNVSSCTGWKPKKWEISSDGSFTFWGINRVHPWEGKYTGNLLKNEAEFHNTPQAREKLKKFNAVQEGNDWAIKLRMGWPGGGCDISFKLRVKQ